MSKQELTTIIPTSPEPLPFPKGTRAERDGDVTYIYDPTGHRRWVMHQYVDHEKQQKLRLELQAEASGGTWHQLMGLYQARDARTGEEIATGVNVDVIDGNTSNGDNSTPNINFQYGSLREEVAYKGWCGGYYGRKEIIERDLEGFQAVATTPDQLPNQIDVYGTVEKLAETFWAGKFEPPQFVLPNETRRLPGIKAVSSLLRRIGGRESRAVQPYK